MTENSILYEMNQLPDNLKDEVLHFIIFLKKEYLHSNGFKNANKRIFGRVKGKYKLAPDFDEPLEEFKEYI